MGRLSLRWRLVLASGSIALGIALVLALLFHLRTRSELHRQFERSLENKCDEVITVLTNSPAYPWLEEFFRIETTYRFTPHTYFYQVTDPEGRVLARSANLGGARLAAPDWSDAGRENRVRIQEMPHPISSAEDSILLRSERVEIAREHGDKQELVVQTAVSLGPYHAALRETLAHVVSVAGFGLSSVVLLLSFAVGRALAPVAAMTNKASQITARNLRERLPLSGRGDELDDLATVLNGMLDRVSASLRQIEQFSADAAHQLQTPLAAVRAQIQLMLSGGLPDECREEFESIQEEVGRLGHLCGRLLLLAYIDRAASGASCFHEEVDLGELVDEIVEQVAPLAAERGIELRRGSSSVARIPGSRQLLVEALQNLLDNAIRATPAGGSITVSLETDADRATLSVEDSGPGVADGEKERIFERFYRTRAVPATERGSGLGLAIVRGIAQAHGGHAEVADAPGGGCVFRLVLAASSPLPGDACDVSPRGIRVPRASIPPSPDPATGVKPSTLSRVS